MNNLSTLNNVKMSNTTVNIGGNNWALFTEFAIDDKSVLAAYFDNTVSLYVGVTKDQWLQADENNTLSDLQPEVFADVRTIEYPIEGNEDYQSVTYNVRQLEDILPWPVAHMYGCKLADFEFDYNYSVE